MLNTPQENLKLPEELKKAIDKSRNIVTLNEAEAVRLKQLSVSMEYQIGELNKEIVEKTEELERLNKAINQTRSSIENDSKELDNLVQEIQEIEEKKKRFNGEMATLEIKLNNRQSEINEQTEELQQDRDRLAKEEKRLVDLEVRLNDKLNKIKEFAKEIC